MEDCSTQEGSKGPSDEAPLRCHTRTHKHRQTSKPYRGATTISCSRQPEKTTKETATPPIYNLSAESAPEPNINRQLEKKRKEAATPQICNLITGSNKQPPEIDTPKGRAIYNTNQTRLPRQQHRLESEKEEKQEMGNTNMCQGCIFTHYMGAHKHHYNVCLHTPQYTTTNTIFHNSHTKLPPTKAHPHNIPSEMLPLNLHTKLSPINAQHYPTLSKPSAGTISKLDTRSKHHDQIAATHNTQMHTHKG